MEAIVFVGVQASGKTTFYKQRFFDTHVRISLDMLKTRHRERALIEACLAAQQPFVIDNTNTKTAERAAYIAAARQAGFRVIGYHFLSELRAAIARNNQRTGKQKVPVPGLIGTWKRIEQPQLEEGFDELHTVELQRDGTFVVDAHGEVF